MLTRSQSSWTDIAGEPISRKSTTGLVAKIGNHTVKSRSMYRIQLKIEIQSDSSTAIDWEQDSDRSTLTRGTFGYKNEFMMETSVSRKFLRRKTAKMWNEASLCFSTTRTLQVCRIGILLTKLHYKMKVTSP